VNVLNTRPIDCTDDTVGADPKVFNLRLGTARQRAKLPENSVLVSLSTGLDHSPRTIQTI